MTSSNNVVAMPPRGKHGKARNYEWWITYEPVTRRWSWRVTFTVTSTLSGDCDTIAEAQAAVDQHVRQVRA